MLVNPLRQDGIEPLELSKEWCMRNDSHVVVLCLCWFGSWCWKQPGDSGAWLALPWSFGGRSTATDRTPLPA